MVLPVTTDKSVDFPTQLSRFTMADSSDKGFGKSTDWGAEYYNQERLRRSSREWKTLFQPSVIGAFLAIAGRVVVAPIVMILLFTGTKYLSDATVLIKSANSFFAFTEHDLSMAGGCTDCMGACKIVLLKYVAFDGQALTSAPAFTAFAGQAASGTVYDFSPLSDAAIALGKALDDGGAICQSGRNEWGSTTNVVTTTPQLMMDVITTMNLSLPPQQMKELELGIEHANECVTTWSMMGTARLFFFPTTLGSADFGKIPAVVVNIGPDYTECRPNVAVDNTAAGSKLALNTGGKNLLSVVPEVLTLFPYSFTSSLATLKRVVAAGDTHYKAETVVEPLLQAYYGGCRVREVNTTGVYIEAGCDTSAHWEIYGSMVQSPDDVPLCSTGDVCIHNYFNTQWEWVSEITAAKPNRVAMFLNTFRSRYADTVEISVLPGVVVVQMLVMGIVGLYQAMSHKRSVLLTQIWAYRCQNGRMQVVYLAQITYHLVYNSDLYLLGFATGTLTTESLANLTCCFFAFSYSFVNLAKARSGDQQLDRQFRLTWEAMQIVIIATVVAILRSVQHTSMAMIIENNAQILRKTSALGAKYCGLNDACVLFTVDLPSHNNPVGGSRNCCVAHFFSCEANEFQDEICCRFRTNVHHGSAKQLQRCQLRTESQRS